MSAILLYVLGALAWFGYAHSEVSPSATRYINVVVLLWLPLLVFIWTPRRMWNEAQRRIAELEAQLEPGIKFLYQLDNEHFCQAECAAPDVVDSVKYRVGIRNTSKGKSIQNASVQLEVIRRVLPESRPIYSLSGCQLPLRLREGFSLEPDTKAYVDVVKDATNAHDKCYVGTQLIPIPTGDYEFTLLATGNDISPARIVFEVQKRKGARLIFRPKGATLDP
jgi:hypothetical protein